MIGVWLVAYEIKLKEIVLNWLKMEKQLNSKVNKLFWPYIILIARNDWFYLMFHKYSVVYSPSRIISI